MTEENKDKEYLDTMSYMEEATRRLQRFNSIANSKYIDGLFSFFIKGPKSKWVERGLAVNEVKEQFYNKDIGEPFDVPITCYDCAFPLDILQKDGQFNEKEHLCDVCKGKAGKE